MRALLLAWLLSSSPDAGTPPQVRMTWSGTTIRLTYKGKVLSYDVGKGLEESHGLQWVHPLYRQKGLSPAPIDAAKTVKLFERDGVVWLLAQVSGPSGGSPTGMCGAGTEGGLALFAFDAKGERRPPEYVLTESCWVSLGDGAWDFAGALDASRVASISYLDNHARPDGGEANQEVTAHVALDVRHPEKGLQVEEQCRDAETSKSVPCRP